MPSFNIRNLPDDLHERISRAAARAERSLEAEVRYTLAAAYPNSTGLSLKQEWMQATARRLHDLTAQLKSAGFWRHRGPGSLAQLAGQIKEETPARLLGWMDGTEPLTFDGAQRIAGFTGCDMEWLIDGTCSMFAYTLMDNDYEGFFLPITPKAWRYHLIRPETGADSGQVPLLVIRENKDTHLLELAYFGGHFYLSDGMGSTGLRKLKEFLQFLKRHSRQLDLRAYMLDIDYEDVGAHHPCFYLNKSREHESLWLERMLNGEAPEWLTEFSAQLDEVTNTPADA